MKTILLPFLVLSGILLLSFFQPANATIRTFKISGTTSSFNGSTSGLAMSATIVYDDASAARASEPGFAYYNFISFTIIVGATTYTASSGSIAVQIPPTTTGSSFSVSANSGLYQLSLSSSNQVFSTDALPTTLALSDFISNNSYMGVPNISGGDYSYYANVAAITEIFQNSITTDPSATITGPLCAGSTVSVPFTASGTYNGDNIFYAYLSNSSGVFDYTQPVIGSLASTTSGTITATIPASASYGTGYLINVVSSDPAVTGTPNANAFTISTLPVPSLSQIPTGGVCPGNIITDSTDARQNNYVWTVSGTAGTDYIITGGGSGNHFISLQLLTALSQPVTVNYTNSNGCTATNPSSISTTVNPMPKIIVVPPAAVCTPGTVDLTATAVTAGSDPGLTYTYFIDLAASSPVATPTTVGNGTYYIVGTNPSTGCSSYPQPVTATVNPLPIVTFNSTLTNQCAGNTSYTLTGGSPSGGIYSGSGVSGTNFDAAIAGTGASEVITYTYTDGNNCTNSATNSITVNPLPTLASVAQSAPVCDGSQATINLTGLLAASSQTVSYSIGSGATMTAVVLSDGNGNGSFPVTLSYAIDYGLPLTVSSISVFSGGVTCSSLSFTSNNSTPLEVNPLPSANISTSSMVTAVSTGNIASVDNAGAGAVYSWTISNGNITAGAGTNSITYMAGASGEVSLSVLVTGPPPTNCASASSGTLLIPITALPCPNPAITTPWVVCSSSGSNKASVSEPATGNIYAWSISNGIITGSATANSITYSAGAAGLVTLSVNVTNASGQCSVSSGKYFILISPLPSAAIIAPPSACASAAGNIAFVPWAGPGATYAWSITNGTLTAGSGSDIIAFKAPSSGTVTLSATVTNIAGCKTSSSAKSIAVVAYPVDTITAPSSVCAGSSGNNASVTSAGTGARYEWSISNGVITSGTNTTSIIYTATKSGSVTLGVIVSNSGGCSATSPAKVIPIAAVPNATITTGPAVCASSTGNIASVASAGSGTTYAWTLSPGSIITSGSGSSSIKYNAPASGTSLTISVTVTNSSGCKLSSGTVKVGMNTSVTPTFASIPTLCKSATAPKLPTTSLNGISGTWKPSTISTASTGTTKYVFSPASGDCASSITLSVTVQTCREAADVPDEQTITSEGVSDAQGRTALIFPNPSVSGFTLYLNSSKKEDVDIVVMDVMGHGLYHTRGAATATYQFGGNFIKGMYFIQILYKNRTKVLKAIRQ